MCPTWEWNLGSFGSQASDQAPEPHQPGHHYFFQYICSPTIFPFSFWDSGDININSFVINPLFFESIPFIVSVIHLYFPAIVYIVQAVDLS